MEDDSVTDQERAMLNALAKSLQLSEKKVEEIEQGYNEESTSKP